MSIGNSYLRREFQDFTAAEQQDDCPRKRLGITFFRYMVKKTIDNFILSGAHDVGAQADCLNTIVQLAFNILLARDKKEAKTARGIRTPLCPRTDAGSRARRRRAGRAV
jgi:hypothetical protein